MIRRLNIAAIALLIPLAATATPPPPPPAVAGFAAERVADGKCFYDVVRVDLAAQPIQLFWRDAGEQAYGNFHRLRDDLGRRGERLIFATNAGIYGKDLRPLGLHVERGMEMRPLNRSRGGGNFFLAPNGVFAIAGGQARILTTEAYGTADIQPDWAVQSGPMLLIDGAHHPRFLVDSDSLYIRNGVGLVSPTEVVFVLSNRPVNFHRFASFFRDRLQCSDALYLDGSLSEFYLPALERTPAGRDFVGILGVTVPASVLP